MSKDTITPEGATEVTEKDVARMAAIVAEKAAVLENPDVKRASKAVAKYILTKDAKLAALVEAVRKAGASLTVETAARAKRLFDDMVSVYDVERSDLEQDGKMRFDYARRLFVAQVVAGVKKETAWSLEKYLKSVVKTLTSHEIDPVKVGMVKGTFESTFTLDL